VVSWKTLKNCVGNGRKRVFDGAVFQIAVNFLFRVMALNFFALRMKDKELGF